MSNNGNSNKENFDSQFPHIDFLKLKCNYEYTFNVLVILLAS